MNQDIRSKLRSVVTQCRRLLEESIAQELEGKYGIFARKDQVIADPNASMTHLSDEEQAARKDILDHFAHIKARGFKPKEALDQLVREIAFTHLNRLCAYKMMEAREVYVGGQKFREAVSRGVNSNGVKFYLAEHEEDERLFNTGHQDLAYRHFLDWLGGTLSDEIGVLFNPNDPANRLYPRQKTLDEVLDLLNGGGIKAEETELREQWPQIWSQDETIGWVYQYFTPKELRDQARKESQAPRNSYELAFRNQFFTPRYVVEFLTDNTLGRIWYEMRQGDTRLKDQCRYMVRRPNEIFEPQINADEHRLNEESEKKQGISSTICVDPCSSVADSDLSQEELLKLPVYIPHRPKKDPRELKILDPACGSGHFLLYCFDLLLTIYEEAYADPDLGPALQKDYPTLEDLRRHLPRLILAHNLHGIDIDLRASQIAALALWLRCQRAYQELGLKKDRPKITRSNFVCAEPMPGEESMLKEFVGQLEPKVLGQVVEVVFDKMKLAGEAGSLLKIEEEIRDAVAEAKKQWVRETTQAMDRKGQPLLFTEGELDQLDRKPEQPSLFDFTDLTDAQFFENAETRVIEALRSYAEKAQNGQKLQKRLFTEDAVRGFSFVDLCHKRYDVLLMNPPFGERVVICEETFKKQYGDGKLDLDNYFYERANSLISKGGLIGAITPRTALYKAHCSSLRNNWLNHNPTPIAFVELDLGVLDSATVRPILAVFIKIRLDSRIFYRNLKHSVQQAADLRQAVSYFNNGVLTPGCTFHELTRFREMPGSRFSLWATESILAAFKFQPTLEPSLGNVTEGLTNEDDMRFLRCWWETSQSSSDRWRPFAKYDSRSTFVPDFSIVIDWDDVAYNALGGVGNRRANERYYFQPGIAFTRSCEVGMAATTLPSGCVFSGVSRYFLHKDKASCGLLAYLNTRVVEGLHLVLTPDRDRISGTLRKVPLVVSESLINSLEPVGLDLWQRKFLWLQQHDETFRSFCCGPPETPLETVKNFQRVRHSILELEESIELAVRSVTILGTEDLSLLDDEVRQRVGERDLVFCNLQVCSDAGAASGLISIALGYLVGRWDIRYITGERSIPSAPDPFAPLPKWPHGMLQQHGCMSVQSHPKGYPINIISGGIIPDDPDNSDDVIRRLHEVFELNWKNQIDVVETEFRKIIGVRDLRDYFRKSGKGGFWDDHISRYSKSRRKAPIYWLLQSSKKNYALWLYYHRLDKDLLFKALVNYVEPKIRLETSRLETLRNQKTAAGDSGKDAKRLAKDVERQEDFLSELRDFEDKLRRAANLHLEPDLNDGVVLNIAPLHELVPWKEARKYWDELLEGKYEWSAIGKQLREKGLIA